MENFKRCAGRVGRVLGLLAVVAALSVASTGVAFGQTEPVELPSIGVDFEGFIVALGTDLGTQWGYALGFIFALLAVGVAIYWLMSRTRRAT